MAYFFSYFSYQVSQERRTQAQNKAFLIVHLLKILLFYAQQRRIRPGRHNFLE